MATTLAELLVGVTPAQAFDRLLQYYKTNGFPVESWQEFGTERTRAQAYAAALSDVATHLLPQIAGGALVDYSTGNWVDLLASNYGLTRNPAVFTTGGMTLTAGAGAGPYVITAGQLTAVFPDTGNRYRNTTGGTLNPSSSLAPSWVAEHAGASYRDPNNNTVSLVTPLPGVTISNPPTDYTDVSQVGTGTGTVTLSGTPTGSHTVTLRIDSTGSAGVASWSYSLDGSPYVSVGAVASYSISLGGGHTIGITLVDGGIGTSFVLNDIYTFGTPGNWVTSQGADQEGNTELLTRCAQRWASLSALPTSSWYELMVKSTPSYGSQVTQVKVLPDTVVANKVNIVCAGPAGSLPGGVVSAIQAWVAPRVILTERPNVTTPTNQTVNFSYTVTVAAQYITTINASILVALQAYMAQVGINGTIRLSKVIEIIMEQDGVVDVSGVTIDGSATNLTLGSSTTFVTPLPALSSPIVVTA